MTLCYNVGAGGGIGRQLALEFAAHGAKLVLWDINKGTLYYKGCKIFTCTVLQCCSI